MQIYTTEIFIIHGTILFLIVCKCPCLSSTYTILKPIGWENVLWFVYTHHTNLSASKTVCLKLILIGTINWKDHAQVFFNVF